MATLPALLSAGLSAIGTSAADAHASRVHVEQVTFDEPTYLIVDQVDGEPMATGALDVQKVEIEDPIEIRMYRTIPGV